MGNSSFQQIPRSALTLGLAGLLPFAATALAGLVLDAELQQRALFALGAYGAVILSFLGGIRWGAVLHNPEALGQWAPLALSVLPSIVAWFALLLPTNLQIGLLAAALITQYFLDTDSVRLGALPAWYASLRTVLTAGAVLCLMAGLLA